MDQKQRWGREKVPILLQVLPELSESGLTLYKSIFFFLKMRNRQDENSVCLFLSPPKYVDNRGKILEALELQRIVSILHVFLISGWDVTRNKQHHRLSIELTRLRISHKRAELWLCLQDPIQMTF